MSPLLNAVQTSCTTTDYCTWAELRFSGSRLHAMDDGKLSSASRCYILAFAASAMMLGRAPPNEIASRRFAAALNVTHSWANGGRRRVQCLKGGPRSNCSGLTPIYSD